MFYEYCFLSVLFIDKCENGWKSYGNHCYLFGFNKINWHEAKISKIVINKKKRYIVFIFIVGEDLIIKRRGLGSH